MICAPGPSVLPVQTIAVGLTATLSSKSAASRAVLRFGVTLRCPLKPAIIRCLRPNKVVPYINYFPVVTRTFFTATAISLEAHRTVPHPKRCLIMTEIVDVGQGGCGSGPRAPLLLVSERAGIAFGRLIAVGRFLGYCDLRSADSFGNMMN